MAEIDRGQLVKIARKMVQEKHSGSILLSILSQQTKSRHSSIIAFEDGNIISISYGVKRGMAALPFLKMIETCTYKLNDMVLGRPIAGLLPTKELLNEIEGDGSIDFDAIQNAPAESMHQQPQLKSGGKFNSDSAINILRLHLNQIIGPVATIILDDALDDVGSINTLSQFKSLLQKISKETLDAHERVQFMSDVLSKID